MKTFETEKGNIPKGATHYCNEVNGFNFSWFKGVDTDNFKVLSIGAGGEWFKGEQWWYVNAGINPIPQTKEVEWLNGELVCKVDQIMPIGVFVGLDRAGRAVVELNRVMQRNNNGDSFMVLGLHNIRKPKQETEAERVEREERKAVDVNAMCLSVTSLKLSQAVALYDAGYRKESE